MRLNRCRGKDRLQKGLTVNQYVLDIWKANKLRLVRIAEKGSKTILQRFYRKHKKNILKTLMLTENAHIPKAIAIHWKEASNKQEHWLMHWRWIKSNQTYTQANQLTKLDINFLSCTFTWQGQKKDKPQIYPFEEHPCWFRGEQSLKWRLSLGPHGHWLQVNT